MKRINKYITEKLKLNKDTKSDIQYNIENIVSDYFSKIDKNIKYDISIENGENVNSYKIEIILNGNTNDKWYHNKQILDPWCKELTMVFDKELKDYTWYTRSTVYQDNRLSIGIFKR